MNDPKTWCVALAAVLLWGVAPIRAQAQVSVVAARDNTLFESATGNLSNGRGIHLFAGRTGPGAQGLRRRAVLRFDLTGAVPSGMRVDSVRLRLNMSRAISNAHRVSLHRLTRDWGEAASDAAANEGQGAAAQTNDATWLHAFFGGTRWDSPGGDFELAPSAERRVDFEAVYTWGSTAQMTADVRDWVANPARNFGWILIGEEGSMTTAKRFDSREHPQAANRPTLLLYLSSGVAREDESAFPTAARITTVYPQPAAGRVQVDYVLAGGADVRFELYDLLGRRVALAPEGWRAPGGHRARLEAPGLPPGVYLLRLHAGAAQQVRQVVWTR